MFLFNYQYEIQDGHEERSFLRSRGNLLYRALKSSLIGRSCPNFDDIIYVRKISRFLRLENELYFLKVSQWIDWLMFNANFSSISAMSWLSQWKDNVIYYRAACVLSIS